MRRNAGWVVGLAAGVVVGSVVAARWHPAAREAAAAPAVPAPPTARAPAKLDLTKPFPKAATPAVKAALATAKAPVVALDLTRPFPRTVPVAAAVRPVRYVGPKAPAVPLDLTTPFPKAPVAAVIPPAVP